MFNPLDSRRRPNSGFLRNVVQLFVGYTGDQGGHEPVQVNGGGFFNGALRAVGATLTGALVDTTAAFSGALSAASGTLTGNLTLANTSKLSFGARYLRVVNNKTGSHGVNTNLFLHQNDYNLSAGGQPAHAVVRIRVYLYNSDIQAEYAMKYAEYLWHVGGTGGANFSGIDTIYTYAPSSGVTITVGFSVSTGHSGDSEVFSITPSVSGAGASQAIIYATAESLGDNSSSLAAA